MGGRASWVPQYEGIEGAIRMRNYSPKTLASYRLWMRSSRVSYEANLRTNWTAKMPRRFCRTWRSGRVLRPRRKIRRSMRFGFFYRHVLRREFGKLDGVVRAKRRPYVPVVLSRSEVEAVLSHLEPPYHLVALLLYGCGLRLSECLELRVQCFNLEAMLLTVNDGKGRKDRAVPLPRRALPGIRDQLDAVRRLHQEDLASGYTGVFLPRQLERKYKNAAKQFIWQWLFPAARLTLLPAEEKTRSGI